MTSPGRDGGPAESLTGSAYVVGYFVWWALALFYFKAMAYVAVVEIVGHRIIWSAVLLIGLLAMRGRLTATLRILRDPRQFACLVATAGLLGYAMSAYVWGIAHDRLLDISLGFYITPLVNVLLGYVFLRERLGIVQVASLPLAGIGVAIIAIGHGGASVFALAYALALGFYGLLRKMARIDPSAGVAAEVTLLSPLALALLLYLSGTQQLTFGHLNRTTDMLLIAAGILTVLPTVMFVSAVKHLRYTSLGLIMFARPTIAWALAVFIFSEPFDILRLYGFCCIWLALLVYAVGTFRHRRLTPRPPSGTDSDVILVGEQDRALCRRIAVVARGAPHGAVGETG